MKLLFILFISLFSTGIFAAEGAEDVKLCYTHGECQDTSREYAPRCFIVKTGTTSEGAVTCTQRCPMLPMGSYCDFIPGHAFGVCKKESYPIPVFDLNDCSSAVDPSDF